MAVLILAPLMLVLGWSCAQPLRQVLALRRVENALRSEIQVGDSPEEVASALDRLRIRPSEYDKSRRMMRGYIREATIGLFNETHIAIKLQFDARHRFERFELSEEFTAI